MSHLISRVSQVPALRNSQTLWVYRAAEFSDFSAAKSSFVACAIPSSSKFFRTSSLRTCFMKSCCEVPEKARRRTAGAFSGWKLARGEFGSRAARLALNLLRLSQSVTNRTTRLRLPACLELAGSEANLTPRSSQMQNFTSEPSLHQSRNQKHQGLSVTVPSANHRDRKGGHADTILRPLPPLLHGCLLQIPPLYRLLLDLRNLVGRISHRRKRRYHVYGLLLGPLHQVGPAGHPEMNTRTRSCTNDIENFVDAHPWATMVDLETYRDAWARGAEWAARNPQGSCRLDTDNPA